MKQISARDSQNTDDDWKCEETKISPETTNLAPSTRENETEEPTRNNSTFRNSTTKYITTDRSCPNCMTSIPNFYVRLTGSSGLVSSDIVNKPLRCLTCNHELPKFVVKTYRFKKHGSIPSELLSRFSHGAECFVKTISNVFDSPEIVTKTPCHICGGLFDYGYIRKHEQSHDESRTKCEKCGRFIKNLYLISHLRKHEEPTQEYVCDICGKLCSTKSTLDRHRDRHIDLKIECKLCDMTFRREIYLKNHLLSHTKEQPHECTVCNRRFSLKRNLTTHLRLHSDTKPYRCSYCSETYRHNVSLKRHIVVKHPGCPLPDSGVYTGRPKRNREGEDHKMTKKTNKKKPHKSLSTK